MTMTDPIADLLTRIRNAYSAGHEKVSVSDSKVKRGILSVLKEEGYISSFKEGKNEKGHPVLDIELKYMDEDLKEPVITKIQRVSKPGLRQYLASEEMPQVLNGLGIAVISTSKGIMTGHKAKKSNVGGEYLCKVW